MAGAFSDGVQSPMLKNNNRLKNDNNKVKLEDATRIWYTVKLENIFLFAYMHTVAMQLLEPQSQQT
jgi:hypothetical protein